jgi:hypothetical protein
MGATEQAKYDQDIAARQVLGETVFAAAKAKGQTVTPEQAIGLAPAGVARYTRQLCSCGAYA